LRERGFTRLFFAGLATDFCVAYSAEDAIRLGFQAIILDDACRAIALPSSDGATTLTTARARLTTQGALFLPTTALRS
jgi:nicotinamidase/pyrazinamidase